MPTVSDIRIQTALPRNPKTKRLVRLLGDHGLMSLIRLWIFAAEQRTDGVLSNMTVADIEEESGWKGEKGDFVSTLTDELWLDPPGESGWYTVHQWADHQPWVYNAPKRSQIAKDNAAKSWETRRSRSTSTGKKKVTAVPVDLSAKGDAGEKSPAFEDLLPVRQIIEYLNEKSGKNYSITSRSTKGFIAARWKEGYGLEDFKKVIDNQVAVWKGDTEMDKYLRPETLFNERKFQSYLNALPPDDKPPKGTDTAGRTLEDLV